MLLDEEKVWSCLAGNHTVVDEGFFWIDELARLGRGDLLYLRGGVLGPLDTLVGLVALVRLQAPWHLKQVHTTTLFLLRHVPLSCYGLNFEFFKLAWGKAT